MVKVDWLKNTVIDYFTKTPQSLQIMQQLIQKRKKKNNEETERPLSGRLLDFFIVKYSMLHNSSYEHPDGGIFDVHDAYLSQCNKWKKRFFDPFARASLHMDEDDPFFTIAVGETEVRSTLCQFNFYMWAISNGVIEYVMQNKTDIIREFEQIKHVEKLWKTTKKIGSHGNMSGTFTDSARNSFELKFGQQIIAFNDTTTDPTEVKISSLSDPGSRKRHKRLFRSVSHSVSHCDPHDDSSSEKKQKRCSEIILRGAPIHVKFA